MQAWLSPRPCAKEMAPSQSPAGCPCKQPLWPLYPTEKKGREASRVYILISAKIFFLSLASGIKGLQREIHFQHLCPARREKKREESPRLLNKFGHKGKREKKGKKRRLPREVERQRRYTEKSIKNERKVFPSDGMSKTASNAIDCRRITREKVTFPCAKRVLKMGQ